MFYLDANIGALSNTKLSLCLCVCVSFANILALLFQYEDQRTDLSNKNEVVEIVTIKQKKEEEKAAQFKFLVTISVCNVTLLTICV